MKLGGGKREHNHHTNNGNRGRRGINKAKTYLSAVIYTIILADAILWAYNLTAVFVYRK